MAGPASSEAVSAESVSCTGGREARRHGEWAAESVCVHWSLGTGQGLGGRGRRWRTVRKLTKG